MVRGFTISVIALLLCTAKDNFSVLGAIMVETYISDIISPLSFSAGKCHDVLATAYLKGVLGKLSRATPTDTEARRIIDQSIMPMLAQLPVTSRCWQPEVGALMQRMREGNQEGAVAQALLVLHALGIEGNWELELSQPTDFSFAGHFFRWVGRMTVSTVGAEINISGAQGQRLRLVSRAGRWGAPDGGAQALWYRQPGYCRHGAADGVYIHDWAEPEVVGDDVVVEWPITAVYSARESLVESAVNTIDAGLEVLEQAGDYYLRWVGQLFRGVAATPLRFDDMRQSGSYLDHPGVFNCGFPGFAAESTAEVIVHEISHQNFLLLNSVFPLSVDYEDDLIYSALKGRKRPLSRVLFAFHAAANMALFWDDLATRQPLHPYYENERQTMYRHTRSLADGIAQARGLTEAGTCFFKHHSALLADRGIVPHAG
jgi:HEXXH motif-containing protein